MPCYNAEDHLARGVESALGQTFQDMELIVVDDGSTDASREILNRFTDSRLKVISQKNCGVSAARNRGIIDAAGEYIAFLDADDTWDPTCLEKLYDALSSAPDAALSYCGWQNMNLPEGRAKPYVPPDYEEEKKMEHLLRSCPWPIHAVLARKVVIESAGRFDDNLTHAEDYKLWLRIAAFNRIILVPEVLAFYYFHGGTQASKKRAQAARDHWVVQIEFLKEFPAVTKQLGRRHVRHIVNGYLLKRGYECYWSRDLKSARSIFRLVMSTGYGSLGDWKYMMPSLLPLPIHRWLIQLHDSIARND